MNEREWLIKLLIGLLIWMAATAAGAVLIMGLARAHSHYPAECCSDTDCGPMGEDTYAREALPQETPEGWVLFDGSLVGGNEARRSPDGRYHVCRSQAKRDGAVIQPMGRPKCFWAPAPSF